jgi:serine/threonine-protein kinase HipA
LWGKKKHYLWNTIQKHHFLSTATRCGFDASSCAEIIEDMISKTSAVINRVSTELPPGFPAQVADSIFNGLKHSASTACMTDQIQPASCCTESIPVRRERNNTNY